MIPILVTSTLGVKLVALVAGDLNKFANQRRGRAEDVRLCSSML